MKSVKMIIEKTYTDAEFPRYIHPEFGQIEPDDEDFEQLKGECELFLDVAAATNQFINDTLICLWRLACPSVRRSRLVEKIRIKRLNRLVEKIRIKRLSKKQRVVYRVIKGFTKMTLRKG